MKLALVPPREPTVSVNGAIESGVRASVNIGVRVSGADGSRERLTAAGAGVRAFDDTAGENTDNALDPLKRAGDGDDSAAVPITVVGVIDTIEAGECPKSRSSVS